MNTNAIATVGDVLLHHLSVLQARQLDQVMLDYTNESVLMSPDQTFQGMDEIRAFFQAMIAGSPPEVMKAMVLIRQDIKGDVAYITWKAEPFVKMGSDTFVIRDGKIITQTFLTVS
jgi:ketosteroid isomerase-like protein